MPLRSNGSAMHLSEKLITLMKCKTRRHSELFVVHGQYAVEFIPHACFPSGNSAARLPSLSVPVLREDDTGCFACLLKVCDAGFSCLNIITGRPNSHVKMFQGIICLISKTVCDFPHYGMSTFIYIIVWIIN